MYGECVQVLTDKTLTARKQHKCGECNRVIEVGEIYRYEAFIGDGFDTHKTCRHCSPIRNIAMDIDSEGMFFYGMIQEQLWESSAVDDPSEWKVRLAIAGMRRKWKRKDGKMWKVFR